MLMLWSHQPLPWQLEAIPCGEDDPHCCLWGRQGEEGSGVVLLLLLPICGILSMYPVMLSYETGGCVE